MSGAAATVRSRRRLVPLALATAVLCSTVLVASVTGTLSAFAASVTNSSTAAAAARLAVQEVDGNGGAKVCASSDSTTNQASCTTNAYSGATGMTPGSSNPSSLFFQNTGTTAPNTFTLLPGSCASSPSGSPSLCDSLTVALTCTASDGGSAQTVYASGASAPTLTAIAGQSVTLPSACVPKKSAANTVEFDFVLTLASGAPDGVQGQSISQSLKWTFSGA